MPEQQITAVILAATERGGMGSDYFENKTRHLLPLAGKPLIQHLIETADKCEEIGKKRIIIEEKVEQNEKEKPCEETYKALPEFGKRIGGDIELVGEDSLTQAGTFAAVHEYIDKKDENGFPLLVLYGDTLVEEKFLRRIVGQYYDEQEPSKIVWGLVESKKEIDKFIMTKPRGDKNNGFWNIGVSEDGSDIINLFEYPLLREEGSYDFLHDTGIMIISEDAWNAIHKLIHTIHRPSPLGLFSFTNILKQALVFKDVNIKIIGVVASEDHWNEANYPWEILALNKIKISDSVKDAVWTGKEEKEIGQKPIFVPAGKGFTMPNGARIKGPCILGKDVKIDDYAIIKNSYIGDDCTIECHASIHDSTLAKGVRIYHHAVIENSIIMEESEVYYHAEILHSIVGKKVLIGSDVKTPCQRLKDMKVDVDGEPAYQDVIYFSAAGIKRTEKFGAIIGDFCQIGSGTVIHPGRMIGKRSKIYSNCEILKNVKPSSNIKNKNMMEGYD